MKKAVVKGLEKMSGGRGPFAGTTHIELAECDVECGHSEEQGAPVVILRPRRGGNVWHMIRPSTLGGETQAETIAAMLCAMGTVSLAQLRSMGFTENTFTKVT